MSEASMLRQIERVERIADMLAGCNEDELNSLVGQASGAMSAVVYELHDSGISTDNDLLKSWGQRLESGRGNVDDVTHALQLAAGFLRARVDELR